MKLKSCQILIIFILILGIIFNLSIINCKGESIGLEIIDTSYELGRPHNSEKYYYYNINITFQNHDNEPSLNTTIKFVDIDGSQIFHYDTFLSNEIKSIIKEIPLPILDSQELIISYYPTDAYVSNTSGNSGEITLMIGDVDSGSTPGFEIIILISAIILFMFFKRKY